MQGAQQAAQEGWTQAGEALSLFDAQSVQPVLQALGAACRSPQVQGVLGPQRAGSEHRLVQAELL